MDAERVRELEAVMRQQNEKLFGPETQEFRSFFERQEVLDHSRILGCCGGGESGSEEANRKHVISHVLVEKEAAMTPALARGYFEGKTLKMNPDDVLLASFPKTGTTWVQEIMFLILSDLDLSAMHSVSIDERAPFLEWPECTLKVLRERRSPKFVKTHLPYPLLPKGGAAAPQYKIVYTTRNPKDTALSLHHFYRMIKPFQFQGDFRDAVNLFLHDNVIFAPFHKHVLGYWERRNDPNVLVVVYENLQEDPLAEIRRIATFLGKKLSEEQIRTVAENTSFGKMASNPMSNHAQWEDRSLTAPGADDKFMRKGKVGDWKNYFDEDLNRVFDEWIDRKFGKSDITFRYE